MRRMLWLGFLFLLAGCGSTGSGFFVTPTSPPTMASVSQSAPHTPTPTSFIPFPPTQSATTPTAVPAAPPLLRSPTPLAGQAVSVGSAVTVAATPTITPLLPTASASAGGDAAAMIAKLKGAGLPIGDVVVFTAATDPNNLLGRPNQYTSKAIFKDTRLAVQSQRVDLEDGGSVETFTTTADTTARYSYLDAIAKGPLIGEYHYQRGTVILRLSLRLTPDQAAQYQSVF